MSIRLRRDVAATWTRKKKTFENLKRFPKTKTFVEPCPKSTSNDDVLILRRDSEVRRDVIEVSFEKLSSPSSSDAERGSSNEFFGGCVTRPNEELVDAWQSKSLRENENTAFEIVSKYF